VRTKHRSRCGRGDAAGRGQWRRCAELAQIVRIPSSKAGTRPAAHMTIANPRRGEATTGRTAGICDHRDRHGLGFRADAVKPNATYSWPKDAAAASQIETKDFIAATSRQRHQSSPRQRLTLLRAPMATASTVAHRLRRQLNGRTGWRCRNALYVADQDALRVSPIATADPRRSAPAPSTRCPRRSTTMDQCRPRCDGRIQYDGIGSNSNSTERA
jgi:hypothetical protein